MTDSLFDLEFFDLIDAIIDYSFMMFFVLFQHLLSEKHRNFAQSNQYQVVDDIVSKLVFDFVDYERDTPKKKR